MPSLFPPVQSVVLNVQTTCFASSSESEICPGPEPRTESEQKEETQESSPCRQQPARRAGPPSGPVTAGEGHAEEPLGSTDAPRELQARPSEAAGSRSGPRSAPEKAPDGDSAVQLAPPEARPDAAEDPRGSLPSQAVTGPVAPPGSDHKPGLCSEARCSQTERKALQLPLGDASKASPADRLEHNELNEPQQPDLRGGDGKSPRGQPASGGPESPPCDSARVPDLSTGLWEAYMAPEEKGDQDTQVSKETEDYLNSLLEGCLRDAEDCLSYEEGESDLQDLSPDEASYSLQENLPSDDSCLSLDDLAKRIEIAEVSLRVDVSKTEFKKHRYARWCPVFINAPWSPTGGGNSININFSSLGVLFILTVVFMPQEGISIPPDRSIMNTVFHVPVSFIWQSQERGAR